MKDAHLSKLVDLPCLEEINLDSCPVGDWAIAQLADNEVVPNLTSLDLADTELTGKLLVESCCDFVQSLSSRLTNP